jgi:hypothetical protein
MTETRYAQHNFIFNLFFPPQHDEILLSSSLVGCYTVQTPRCFDNAVLDMCIALTTYNLLSELCCFVDLNNQTV